MFKSLLHYFQRARDLGLLGILQRIWIRSKKTLFVRSQSLWWGWKARQKMSDKALLARTTGKWRSVDALLVHLAGRPASSFLLPHESPQETAKLLYQYYPEHISAVLTAADAVCRNEISLLGQVFHYSQGIDWQREPVTGWRWPLLHISLMDEHLWSPTRPADYRLLWELNRHQHFIDLGIAYWLTGEQRYVDAFCSQIQSWIETNPVQHGINWYSSMEVSIRLLAWTVAFQFFRSSPEFLEKTGNAFLKSLWQQADFLSSHLQITVSEVPNNHIIGELVGLILVGETFPEFRTAGAWRDTGLQLLSQQITEQTHSDGVNKEQAMGYQRFVAEFLLLIVAHSHKNTLVNEPILEDTLERMVDYILFSLTPVGTVPMWGDSDYGRALGLGKNRDFSDFRPILSAGATLFGRADWKFAADQFDEEAFWLLGADGLRAWEQLGSYQPEEKSHAFPDAGLYIIRDKWTADTDVAFFRCGPFGLGGEGHSAHAHCDLLSFVLWVGGQPLLVDPGTYTYHGRWRDHFRLTAAHNTVMVDSCEQAIPKPYFNWQHTTEARCIEWNGEHIKGALALSNQAEFIRDLIHIQPGAWELIDKFTGQGKHTLEWFFHFAPGLDLQLQDEQHKMVVLKEGRPFLIMYFPDNRICPQLRTGWYSGQYDVKEEIRVLYVNVQEELDSQGVSFHWQFQLVNEWPLPTGR